MLDSLRARLVLWYALILTLLILLYAGAVSYLSWQSLLRDVDGKLETVAATISGSLTADTSGNFDLDLPPQFREAEFGAAPESSYYAVWNAQGDLVDRSDPQAPIPSEPQLGIRTRDGRRELVIDVAGPARLLVGHSLDTAHSEVRAVAITVAGVGGMVLLLSLIGGSFLAGRALAPIARISKTAGAMVGGDLAARIPVRDTDSELEQVARALNDAFDRMRVAAESQRQFTADASHEFRTPLATLRAEFDRVLSRTRSEADYRGAIEKGQQAVERMTKIADGLLTLARGDHSTLGARRDPVDLAAVIDEAVAMFTPVATTRGVTIQTDVRAAVTTGDRSRLADAFANLLKNAIEYNRTGGVVSVHLSTDGRWASVLIRDTGIGIAVEDLPRIFERFYRADRSRNRQVGGAGLGLAIVKKTIEDHDGTVACSSTLGVGTEFTVRLPLTISAAVS